MDPVASLIDTFATTKDNELASSREASTSNVNVRLNDDNEAKPDGKPKDVQKQMNDRFISVPRPELQLQDARLNDGAIVHSEELRANLTDPGLSLKDENNLAPLERPNNKEVTTLKSENAFHDHKQRVRKDRERHREPLCVS